MLAGEATLVGPAKEEPDMPAVRALRQPHVDVSLREVGQQDVVVVQPGESAAL
jgi:hypothetical protein